MKKKCPKCNMKRDTEYEYANIQSLQCVFCEDIDRENKRKLELKNG